MIRKMSSYEWIDYGLAIYSEKVGIGTGTYYGK
jgi:hypothetical protein